MAAQPNISATSAAAHASLNDPGAIRELLWKLREAEADDAGAARPRQRVTASGEKGSLAWMEQPHTCGSERRMGHSSLGARLHAWARGCIFVKWSVGPGMGRWAPGGGRRILKRVSVMAIESGELSVELQARPDTDAEELTDLAGRLRAELLDLDVDAVRQSEGGEAPEGSKGVGL